LFRGARLSERIVERRPRVRHRGERTKGVGLQRLHHPTPDREWNAIERGGLDLIGSVIGVQPASEYQRQSDRANLEDVGAGVDGNVEGDRERHTKFFPVTLAGIAQLFDRRAEHLFDQDHPAFRRHHNPIGADRAVNGVGHLVAPCGRREYQLSDDRGRRRQIDRQGPPFRACQECRQPRTADMVGQDRQRAALAIDLDAPHAGERVVTEPGDSTGTFPQ